MKPTLLLPEKTLVPHSCESRNLLQLKEISDQVRDEGGILNHDHALHPHSCESRNLLKLKEIPDQVRDEGGCFGGQGDKSSLSCISATSLRPCLNYAIITHSLRTLSAMPAYCLLILCLVIGFPALHAEISQSLEGADSLNVGTPFTFKVKADYAIKQLSIPDTLKSFAIVKSEQSERSTREWEMTLVPLRVGALSFPRLQVQPSIPAYKAEYTDGFRVNVLSVLAEGDTLLRDIKPFEKYPWQPPFWLYLLLLLLALGLAIYLLTKRKKRKPKAQKAETIIPEKARPPWETALAELDALFAESLLEKGELILYHFKLSQILRAFLEAVYSFPALEMTTRELSSEMHKLQIPETGEIKRWLSYCDMVKFAKTVPSGEEVTYRSDWLKNYLLSYSRQQTGENGA